MSFLKKSIYKININELLLSLNSQPNRGKDLACWDSWAEIYIFFQICSINIYELLINFKLLILISFQYKIVEVIHLMRFSSEQTGLLALQDIIICSIMWQLNRLLHRNIYPLSSTNRQIVHTWWNMLRSPLQTSGSPQLPNPPGGEISNIFSYGITNVIGWMNSRLKTATFMSVHILGKGQL